MATEQKNDPAETDANRPRLGAIPFLVREGRIVLLLVTSTQLGRWIFPKGAAQKTESHAETCRREAREEAGVDGEVLLDFPIKAAVRKTEGTVRRDVPVIFYPLAVADIHDKWPEGGRRLRHWVLLEEAEILTEDEDTRRILTAFRKVLPAIRSGAG